MDFKNLKITFNFDSPVIINRYLTIDSILLNLHFKKIREEGKIKGFIDTEEYILKNKDDLFIDFKNNVLSGSIWYLYPEDDIWIDNLIIIKNNDKEKVLKVTTAKSINDGKGPLKRSLLGFEFLVIPRIYFYVKGDKNYIEKLLNNLQFIGKKSSLGFGRINSFKIEEIREDKSFMLNEYTPSKPLPIDSWSIKSKKIGYYRSLPPYYQKKDIKACYLPTRSLIEKEDRTFFNQNFSVADEEYLKKYISATKFARNIIDKEYKEYQENEDGENLNEYCAMCGSYGESGIKNIYQAVNYNFNDFAFIDKEGFVCEHCLWSIKSNNEKILGNSFIFKNGINYLQGKKMKIPSNKTPQEFRQEFFSNLEKLTPPFLINIKAGGNTQHVVFKNKVAISNAIIPIVLDGRIQEDFWIDVELLKEAIIEMNAILEQYKCIKKSYLINFEDTKQKLYISSKCGKKERKVLMNFWKKYDRSIRKILNRIVLKKN